MRATALGIRGKDEKLDTNKINSMEVLFRKMLEINPIVHALEIGTWRGISAALIAHYAKSVTTIDIHFHIDAVRAWRFAGIQKKINYIVTSDENKSDVISGIPFDFAFIDGAHNYESVKKDFSLVKKCGRVLFHDYSKSATRNGKQECVYNGPTRVVDELPSDEMTIEEPFAYWERK